MEFSYAVKHCLDDARTDVKKIRSPLHFAVIEQQTETVSDLITSKNAVNLDAQDFKKRTALDYAVQSRNSQIIKLLLDAGANISKSSLRRAIESLNFDFLKLFLDKLISARDSDDKIGETEDKKKDGDVGCSFRTLLELTVSYGNSNILKLLLNYEAVSVKLENDDKKYLLHEAVKTKNLIMVEQLLDYGVNVNAANEFGNTPIHLSLDPKNLDILRLLLVYKGSVNTQNKVGFTPLHLAIKLNNNKTDDCTNIVQLLLEAGADVNTQCKNADYPLRTAVESQNENIVKLLVNAGAKNIVPKNTQKNTALHTAVALQNERIVKLLLDAGADHVDVQNQNGNTPLHLAAERKSNSIFQRILINSESVINDKNTENKTPLYLAIATHNYYTSKMLLEAGADVNLANEYGFTPLQKAAVCKKLDLVKLLLEYGADLNLWSKKNNTPFMLFVQESTVQKNLTEGFKLFLKYSDINLVNAAGKNILSDLLESDQYAEKRDLFYKFILEHVAKVKVLNQQVDSSLLKAISRKSDYRDYFNRCIEELEKAKSTKPRNCRISFLNLLVDDESKFIKYAGNQDLVRDSKKSVKNFPIYGSTMKSNMTQGIEGRKFFDGAADVLSYYLPILNPTHLIIRNTLDALKVEDWKKLCEKKLEKKRGREK